MPQSPGSAFRSLLQRQFVQLPGVYNAITARLAQAAGFNALYISGAGVTNSLLARPDVELLTLSELSQHARYISAAVELPVISDADTGFGGTLNVARTVQEMESAGLAGIHIEDQQSPKRCGHLDGKALVTPAAMATKVAAACRARRNRDFVIIARTDARAVSGFDNTVRRAHLYLEAGADAIFPEALESADEFARFAALVKAPLLANMTEFGKSPLIPAQDLQAMGYSMAIYPMTQFRAMMRAAEQVLAELYQAGTQASVLSSMQSRDDLYTLLDYPAYSRFDVEMAGLEWGSDFKEEENP